MKEVDAHDWLLDKKQASCSVLWFQAMSASLCPLHSDGNNKKKIFYTLKWVTLHFFTGSFWVALKCNDIGILNASVRWTSEDCSAQSFRKKKVIRQTPVPVPVTSFLGEPVLNLTLFCPKLLQLGKYFTAYPLSDIKGLRGSPGDDWWLLRTRAGYSVSKQKIVYFTVLYLVEVEFSISLGSMFVCDCVIPEGCTGCGYVPNPPETWKIPLHSLCVTVTAQLGASPEVWGIPYGYVAFCICYNFISTLLHVAETILKNNVPCSRYETYLYINNRSNDCM